MKILVVCTAVLAIALSVSAQNDYDVIIKGGTVYYGSGGAPIRADF